MRHKNIKEKYEQGTGYSRLKMPFIYPVSIHVRLSHSLIIGAQRKKMSKLKEKRMETEQINCGAKFHNVSDDESSLQK